MWSENDPVYIIAEAGSNHDGSLEQAFSLIDIAADAGADAVKFQCLEPLKREWLPELQKYATQEEIDFLVTPFDVEAVEVLDELDVPAIKIASPEIVNLELVEAVAKTRRSTILSTGMADGVEILDAVQLFDHRTELALLQCTTAYPAPYEKVNLRAMDGLRLIGSDCPVGLSDHSLGIAIPIAAAALGARIIEKHFTLDRSLEGPDHSYALEPDELKSMVEGIRQVQLALGNGVKSGPVEGELVEARGRQLQWTT